MEFRAIGTLLSVAIWLPWILFGLWLTGAVGAFWLFGWQGTLLLGMAFLLLDARFFLRCAGYQAAHGRSGMEALGAGQAEPRQFPASIYANLPVVGRRPGRCGRAIPLGVAVANLYCSCYW